jgi:hypothetical protein
VTVARHRNTIAQRGFTQLENAVLFDATLTAGARLLYQALKHFAWKRDGEIPANKELAATLGFSEKSVRNYYRELADAKLITAERRRGLPSVIVIETPGAVDIAEPPAADSAEPPRQILPGSIKEEGKDQPSASNEASGAGRRSRKPDLLWEELVEVFGGVAPAGLERKRWNTALQSMKQSGAERGDIRAHAAAYRAHETFKDCAITPMALATNWTLLGAVPKKKADRIRERLAQAGGE